MDQDDADLASQSQAGDVTTFNLIVERYQSQVYNLAARILGDRTTAEDIAQETFISAYRAIARFGAAASAQGSCGSPRTSTTTGQERRAGVRRSPLTRPYSTPGFSLPSAEASPEQEAITEELRAELQRAIVTLPPDQRATLVLIDVQGLSYDEAAEASIGTVKSRVSRARSRVRDNLQQHRELLPERFRLIV